MESSSSNANTVFNMNVFAPLIRELVLDTIIDEPEIRADLDSARSFFTGSSLLETDFLQRNLHYGDIYKINLRKQQNPRTLVSKSTLERKDIDACRTRLDIECSIPCLNNLPTFDSVYVTIDTEYAVGVRRCVTDNMFWDMGEYTRQYAASQRAYRFVRELDLWNRVIRNLIATPATTQNQRIAACAGQETHFWNGIGTVAGKGSEAIKLAYWYLAQTYKVNPTVFMAAEAANELINSVQNPYNLNQTTQLVNTFQDWELPGFSVASAVETILGGQIRVVIMQHSVFMDNADGTTDFPLWKEDMTEQYVAILDPRVGYDIEYFVGQFPENANGCDHPYEGLTDLYYVGGGVTFPQYGLILGFSMTDVCL